MLGILILIGIIALFNNGAKKRNLNGILYGVLAIVVWFAAQFLVALLKVYIDPYSSEMELLAWGITGSLMGIGILYAIMVYAGNQKKPQSYISDEIMDSNEIEDL